MGKMFDDELPDIGGTERPDLVFVPPKVRDHFKVLLDEWNSDPQHQRLLYPAPKHLVGLYQRGLPWAELEAVTREDLKASVESFLRWRKKLMRSQPWKRLPRWTARSLLHILSEKEDKRRTAGKRQEAKQAQDNEFAKRLAEKLAHDKDEKRADKLWEALSKEEQARLVKEVQDECRFKTSYNVAMRIAKHRLAKET